MPRIKNDVDAASIMCVDLVKEGCAIQNKVQCCSLYKWGMLNSPRCPRRGKKLPREDEVPTLQEVVTRGREVAATLILFSLGNPFQCRSLFFTWTMEMKTSI